MSNTDRKEAVRARYRDLVLQRAKARSRPKDANRLFDQLQDLYKQLRKTEAGREAIIDLLDDPDAAVRLSAAVHSLAWVPRRAEQVLEEIETHESLDAVTAKYTLRSYRAGTLNLD